MLFHYTADQLKRKYHSLGIQEGDTLFVTTGRVFRTDERS